MDRSDAVDLAVNLARSQDGVVLRSQAEVLGVSPASWRWLLRSEWVPVLPGVAYVPAADACHRPAAGARARAHTAVLRTGGEGIACLGSALRVHGLEGTPSDDLEHVLLRGTRHQPAGGQLHWERVPSGFIYVLGGLRVTGVLRSLHQALRHWDRATAVSVLDSARFQGRLRPREFAHLRVAPLTRERAGWIELSSAMSESPQETRTWLLFIDHGLTGFESQVTLELPGYGRVRVDFLRGRLVVEADGRGAHDGPTAAARDRLRTEALEAAGYVVLRLTWADVVYRPAATVARILRAMRTAALRAG